MYLQNRFHLKSQKPNSIVAASGTVVYWLSVRTRNTEVASSTPARVIAKVSLVRKATGKYLMKSISLEIAQSPVSGFCYARNRGCSAVFIIAKGRTASLDRLLCFS